MTKKGKKRSKSIPEYNIAKTGVGDSVESCLEDLEQASCHLYAKSKETEKEESHDEREETAAARLPKRVAELREERIISWDTEFAKWKNGGQYTPLLLPCFETELARHFQLQKLSRFLLGSCTDLKMPAFERWLLDSKLEERERYRNNQSSISQQDKRKSKPEGCRHRDPVLSYDLSILSKSSRRLLDEICETGVGQQEAKTLIQDLFRRTQASVKEIEAQCLRCHQHIPCKSDRIGLEYGVHLVSLLYSRKKWKSPFVVKINISHYENLKARFLATHAKVVDASELDTTTPNKKRDKVLHAFNLLIMVITLRYSSFSGGQLLDDFRGGGMQGAINEQGFDVLSEFFPRCSLFECFASPLNASLPFFASAFPELDWHFGSVGDLATCTEFIDQSCCEANPPFTPGFMEFLADFIDREISKANNNHKAVTFVVIVPAVHKEDLALGRIRSESVVKHLAAGSHRQMVESKHRTLHIVLPAKQHGYVEGAQHLRSTRYKRSLYDTSVIVLQSQAATDVRLDERNFEERIREAFAERHSEERRKRSKF